MTPGENGDENGDMDEHPDYRHIAASELARRTARDFDSFRRDAYEYRRQAETDLNRLADKLRQESRVSSRWAIGIAVTVGIALGAGIVPNYITLLQRLEHISVRQDTIVEHGTEQDKALESLNQRLRSIELKGSKE